MQPNPTGPWSGTEGPDGDVVISCRSRLARNIAGFPFVSRASDAQRREVMNLARQVLLSDDVDGAMIWVDLTDAPDVDRRLLFERHLISKHHVENDIERGVAVSGDESFGVMVNEEDHLRMQVIAPGLQLAAVHARIDAIDDAIEAKLDYAFSSRWGYLTACPTNVGTGIRFSVMLHLPAMKITNEIERVRRAAKDLHLAVRGYHGEGTESAGDFYQISNQVTLGRSEEEIIEELDDSIIPRIVEYERQARSVLVRKNATLLDDRVNRALGVLQSARLLGVEEAMKLLSRIRLGIHLDRLDCVPAGEINRLFLQIQPAHLQLAAGSELGADELRQARATLVRETLS
jgi:protein arginine kinase